MFISSCLSLLRCLCLTCLQLLFFHSPSFRSIALASTSSGKDGTFKFAAEGHGLCPWYVDLAFCDVALSPGDLTNIISQLNPRLKGDLNVFLKRICGCMRHSDVGGGRGVPDGPDA